MKNVERIWRALTIKIKSTGGESKSLLKIPLKNSMPDYNRGPVSMRWTMKSSVLVRPEDRDLDRGLITSIYARDAGWKFLNLEVRRFLKGDRFETSTDENEAVIVMLGGRIKVNSNKASWEEVGGRADVFQGLPHALYLPRHTDFDLVALDDATEIAYAWAPAEIDYPASRVSPTDIEPEIRGGHNASRQINTIVPPGYQCQRLVSCEAYTPGGNWSSYPPHKHDTIKMDEDGNLIEASLEEIYFYKFNRREGWAMQRVYNDDRSLDEAVVTANNDIVLIPEGYHPVCTAYGYDCYYLNFLAGSHQALTSSDDPAYKWTKETWDKTDPRLPLVTEDSRVPLKNS